MNLDAQLPTTVELFETPPRVIRGELPFVMKEFPVPPPPLATIEDEPPLYMVALAPPLLLVALVD